MNYRVYYISGTWRDYENVYFEITNGVLSIYDYQRAGSHNIVSVYAPGQWSFIENNDNTKGKEKV